MNAKQKPPSLNAVFKVVARRPKRNAAHNTAIDYQPQSMQFYWRSFERMGKMAGIVISLLSLCGILFAAGSKMQHLLDDLAALHKQIHEHEDRLQQNEANDSKQAAEIGYLKGRLEQKPEREENRPEESNERERAEERKETAPAPRRFRHSEKTAASPPSIESYAVPIGDKLYATILYYYNQARRLKPNLAGKLTVICKVDQTGYLGATEVTASSPELTELAERLTERIRRWKFPEHVIGLESGRFHKTYFLSPQGF